MFLCNYDTVTVTVTVTVLVTVTVAVTQMCSMYQCTKCYFAFVVWSN
jgi:hypothetical protein